MFSHIHPIPGFPRGDRQLVTLLTVAVATLTVASLTVTSQSHAQADAQTASPELLSEFRGDPMSFFFDLRAEEAVLCSQTLLTRSDLADEERRDMLTALAAIHLADGRPRQARAAFMTLLATDPTADLHRPESLAPPIKKMFYGLRDSILVARDIELPPDIRTVAIGQIDALPVVPGKYDLEAFARGLTHILTSDLSNATPLRIVDRQRLDVLFKEIGINQNEELLDPKNAVPFGKLTGAQSFLFGSLLQVEEDKIRFDLRWVNTTTSEVHVSEGVEMKVKSADDLFKMERKVLLELLVPKMHEVLVGVSGEEEIPSRKDFEKRAKKYLDGKKKLKMADNRNYLDFLLRTGDALLAEERGDLAAAQAAWSEVAEMRPDDPSLESQRMALAAHIQIAEGESR